jgi:hypothetical protein
LFATVRPDPDFLIKSNHCIVRAFGRVRSMFGTAIKSDGIFDGIRTFIENAIPSWL